MAGTPPRDDMRRLEHGAARRLADSGAEGGQLSVSVPSHNIVCYIISGMAYGITGTASTGVQGGAGAVARQSSSSSFASCPT